MDEYQFNLIDQNSLFVRSTQLWITCQYVVKEVCTPSSALLVCCQTNSLIKYFLNRKTTKHDYIFDHHVWPPTVLLCFFTNIKFRQPKFLSSPPPPPPPPPNHFFRFHGWLILRYMYIPVEGCVYRGQLALKWSMSFSFFMLRQFHGQQHTIRVLPSVPACYVIFIYGHQG